jgi:hypothetical protein
MSSQATLGPNGARRSGTYAWEERTNKHRGTDFFLSPLLESCVRIHSHGRTSFELFSIKEFSQFHPWFTATTGKAKKKKHPALQKAGATIQRQAHPWPHGPHRGTRYGAETTRRPHPHLPRHHDSTRVRRVYRREKRAINAPRLSSPRKQQNPLPCRLAAPAETPNPRGWSLAGEPRRRSSSSSPPFSPTCISSGGGFDFVFLRAEPDFTAPCFPPFRSFGVIFSFVR